jgi:hypothetical protein
VQQRSEPLVHRAGGPGFSKLRVCEASLPSRFGPPNGTEEGMPGGIREDGIRGRGGR